MRLAGPVRGLPSEGAGEGAYLVVSAAVVHAQVQGAAVVAVRAGEAQGAQHGVQGQAGRGDEGRAAGGAQRQREAGPAGEADHVAVAALLQRRLQEVPAHRALQEGEHRLLPWEGWHGMDWALACKFCTNLINVLNKCFYLQVLVLLLAASAAAGPAGTVLRRRFSMRLRGGGTGFTASGGFTDASHGFTGTGVGQ